MASTARIAEVLLGALDIRARQTAISVLGQVGDEDPIAALERFRREDSVPETLSAAEAATLAIRGWATPAAGLPNELEARLKALEEKQEAMRKELDQWAERH